LVLTQCYQVDKDLFLANNIKEMDRVKHSKISTIIK